MPNTSHAPVLPFPPRSARSRRVTQALAMALLSALAWPGMAQRLQASGPLVYDQKTNLTWQRCVYGQHWDEVNQRCRGEVRKLLFDELRLLEVDGWRVPTLDELVSLVRRGDAPTIDAQAFPQTPATYFWATDNRDRNTAWYVSFADGRSNHYYPPRTNRDLVRLVRSGPLKASGR